MLRSFVSVVVCLGAVTSRADAFELYFENSPGIDALEFNKRSGIAVYGDAALIDGAITSSPPDSTYYDRSLMTQVRVVSNVAFTPKMGLRTQLTTGSVIRKQEEAELPRTLTESTRLYLAPAVDGTFVTATGLELVLGVRYQYTNKFKEVFYAGEYESETKYGAAGVMTPRAGIFKRAGFGTGGLYFSGKGEAKRDVDAYAFDGTMNESEDVVFSPSVIGIVARFKVAGYNADAEFAAVQAGEGGNRTAEGKVVEEDHIRARLAGEYPFNSNTVLRVVAIHKTLSYSDSAVVTLDTIPMTTLHIKAMYNAQNMSATAGIVYGEGFDVQSLPEFNAKYLVKSYGATLAGVLQF